MYLLDTNVLSEAGKRDPNPHVLRWIMSVAEESLFLSVVTIGEITQGIARLRRTGSAEADNDADWIQSWLDGLLANHSDQILGIDIGIAGRWGRLCEAHPQFETDMLLAATALEHGLTVATRNVDHFRGSGVRVVNPFAATSR